MPIRILIADDQELICEGLAALLADEQDFQVLDPPAHDGLAAVRMAGELMPDVILMDVAMPRMNGIEAIRAIRDKHRKTHVLVLSVTETEEQAAACLKAGASGYLMKRTNQAELHKAIRRVAMGGSYVSAHLDQARLQDIMSAPAGARDLLAATLTPRERQVMQLIAEGNSNKQIAEILGVGVKTVDTHRTNCMRKLDLHNAAEVTALAHRLGLVGRD